MVKFSAATLYKIRSRVGVCRVCSINGQILLTKHAGKVEGAGAVGFGGLSGLGLPETCLGISTRWLKSPPLQTTGIFLLTGTFNGVGKIEFHCIIKLIGKVQSKVKL